MIAEYEMGEDDHLKHAVDLFINFKAIFQRVLLMLMGSNNDN
jgi:FtsH-binding integral membrane protein